MATRTEGTIIVSWITVPDIGPDFYSERTFYPASQHEAENLFEMMSEASNVYDLQLTQVIRCCHAGGKRVFGND